MLKRLETGPSEAMKQPPPGLEMWLFLGGKLSAAAMPASARAAGGSKSATEPAEAKAEAGSGSGSGSSEAATPSGKAASKRAPPVLKRLETGPSEAMKQPPPGLEMWLFLGGKLSAHTGDLGPWLHLGGQVADEPGDADAVAAS